MALDHLLDLGVSELVLRVVMPSGDLHVVLLRCRFDWFDGLGRPSRSSPQKAEEHN